MSYIALYRAYRPKTFDQVAGQQVVVQTLKNAIMHQKVGHAYLFSGPRGTGKTSIAKIFSKAVNCLHPNEGNPCQVCDVCQGIDRGDIADIIEIDAASNNGVDEIRELRDKVKYMPSVGAYKVYIIDEVHMLSTGAFNALLKTLEEPPKHVIFILATTEIHKIPATILSRCQRFDFKNIDDDDMIKKLDEVTIQEKIDIDKEALYAIARHAEGGLRDALSLLDQSISFTDQKITQEDIAKVAGSVSTQQMHQLLDAFVEKKYEKASQVLSLLFKEGKEASRIVSDMILAFRDILTETTLSIKEVKYQAFHKTISKDKIYAYIEILTRLQNDIKWTQQKRVYIEIAFMKMMQHESIQKIDQMMMIQDLKQEVLTLQLQLKKQEISIKEPSKIKEPQSRQQLVDIRYVCDIINQADKQKRHELQRGWEYLKEYGDKTLAMTAYLISQGELVAVSDHMLLVYDDITVCKNVLKTEIKEQVLQIFNKKSTWIQGFTAILRKDWDILVNLYKESGNHLELQYYDFGLYQENESKQTFVEDDIVIQAQAFFGNKVKIKE